MKILISGGSNKYGLAMSYYRAFQKLNFKYIDIFDDEQNYWNDLKSIKNRYTHRLLWKLFALRTNKSFLKKVLEYKPDLLLVFKGWFYHPKTIKKIKEILPKTKIFCYNQENPFNTNFFTQFSYSNNWVVKSIPLYDVYFTWGEFLIDKIRNKGRAKKVFYLPFGYDPEIHYPLEVKKEDEKNYYGSDIAFIGTYSNDREKLLNYLINNYNLKIWGNGWQKANKKLRKKWQKKDVYGEDFSKVCNSSKIVLDILRPQMIPSHSMKTFEIPACRGFLMCNRGYELSNFFDLEKEIVTFENPKEVLEKIDFYLKNDNLRENIKEAGYQRLINSNHSYLNRVKKILEVYEELK